VTRRPARRVPARCNAGPVPRPPGRNAHCSPYAEPDTSSSDSQSAAVQAPNSQWTAPSLSPARPAERHCSSARYGTRPDGSALCAPREPRDSHAGPSPPESPPPASSYGTAHGIRRHRRAAAQDESTPHATPARCSASSPEPACLPSRHPASSSSYRPHSLSSAPTQPRSLHAAYKGVHSAQPASARHLQSAARSVHASVLSASHTGDAARQTDPSQ
jgi:hypothetical protein